MRSAELASISCYAAILLILTGAVIVLGLRIQARNRYVSALWHSGILTSKFKPVLFDSACSQYKRVAGLSKKCCYKLNSANGPSATVAEYLFT
jgi:hypothetical protein